MRPNAIDAPVGSNADTAEADTPRIRAATAPLTSTSSREHQKARHAQGETSAKTRAKTRIRATTEKNRPSMARLRDSAVARFSALLVSVASVLSIPYSNRRLDRVQEKLEHAEACGHSIRSEPIVV
jgi:hypothetical protein